MKQYSTFVGMDCGDRHHEVCVVDDHGAVVMRTVVGNRAREVVEALAEVPGSLVALEVGTHSRWLEGVLREAGHTVVVANARKLKAIAYSERKTDRNDAELLARLVRFDPKLLHPVVHRGARAHTDLVAVKARDAMVEVRTKLINSVRGLLKSFGVWPPSSSAGAFVKRVEPVVPKSLQAALCPLLEEVAGLTERIRAYDRQLEAIAERYPEVMALRQVAGVGPVTSLAYVLTLEDPHRFRKSRKLGAYLGMTPRQDQSGEIDKELRISKRGDAYLRRLLVSAAQYLLGPLNQQDSALRQFGLRLAQGGKRAKKRAVVAVARKLAVLLHRLWVTGEVYRPFPNATGDENA